MMPTTPRTRVLIGYAVRNEKNEYLAAQTMLPPLDEVCVPGKPAYGTLGAWVPTLDGAATFRRAKAKDLCRVASWCLRPVPVYLRLRP